MFTETKTTDPDLEKIDSAKYVMTVDYSYYAEQSFQVLAGVNEQFRKLGERNNVLIYAEEGDGMGGGGDGYWPDFKIGMLTILYTINFNVSTPGLLAVGMFGAFSDEVSREIARTLVSDVKSKLNNQSGIMITVRSPKNVYKFYFPKGLSLDEFVQARGEADEVIKDWEKGHDDYHQFNFYYADQRWINVIE